MSGSGFTSIDFYFSALAKPGLGQILIAPVLMYLHSCSSPLLNFWSSLLASRTNEPA